jgi:Rrf2 family protein
MISKTGVHAVKALIALAQLPPGAYAGAAAVARGIGARANYLGKLLQTLSREGLVVSQKGFGGGFRLAKPPARISILDIVEPIDHVSRWNRCILGQERCNQKRPCAIHAQWGRVRDAYLRMLAQTRIADLVESGSAADGATPKRHRK